MKLFLKNSFSDIFLVQRHCSHKMMANDTYFNLPVAITTKIITPNCEIWQLHQEVLQDNQLTEDHKNSENSYFHTKSVLCTKIVVKFQLLVYFLLNYFNQSISRSARIKRHCFT